VARENWPVDPPATAKIAWQGAKSNPLKGKIKGRYIELFLFVGKGFFIINLKYKIYG